MATRLRLQRHGKKGKPFYHIVAADARAKRDGRFIEKLGTYNPNTNPATIDVIHDRALYWLQVGAEMSDTARAILKYKGVVYHNHLLNGVKKGALTEEQAQKKFEEWLRDKEGKVAQKTSKLAAAADEARAKVLAHEQEVNAARAKSIAGKQAELAAEAAAAQAAAEAEATTEEAPATEEAAAEAPATEEAAAEAPATEEAPAAEEAPAEEPAAEEAPAEEPAAEEAPVEEPAAEEAPAEEPAAEEAPAEEPAAEEAPAEEPAAEDAPAEEGDGKEA